MAENKTKPTAVDPDDFINALDSEQQRDDSREISRMMTEITGEPAVMWGPSIIGFGTYHYKYASGREGDMCIAGFSPRKPNITVYIMTGFDGCDELLTRLGKYKMSKACIYIKKLDDIDRDVLRELIKRSVKYCRNYKWA
jgi:hypothetical protein